ncbi:hypothetical protein JXA80_10960 [bacterium]|nr:hypothetical protein [candidate division CSSED10-310 bacterium]
MSSGVNRPFDPGSPPADLLLWLRVPRFANNRFLALYGTDLVSWSANTLEPLLQWCDAILRSGAVSGFRTSLRPDSVNQADASILRRFSTIELGVPSMDSSVLNAIQRDHAPACVTDAVHRLRELGIGVGIQTMIGLPGATREIDQASTEIVARLRPDYVRIHPTLVLYETPLWAEYQAKRYVPLDIEEAVVRSAAAWDEYEVYGIPVARCGFHLPDSQLKSALAAGPWHPAFGQLVRGRRWRDRLEAYFDSHPDSDTIDVSQKAISDAVGHRGENRRWLEARFHKRIRFRPVPEPGDYPW